MKAVKSLPENYERAFSVDVEKDKRTALIVNGISLGIFVIMASIMCIFVKPFQLVMPQGDESYFSGILRAGVLFVLLLLYIVLHELTHGVMMRALGASKVNFGFTGLYTYAGSDGYFDKKSFIIIALSPIVIWGVVLAVINILVPYNWIWTVYFIQIVNVAGASSDFYITAKLLLTKKPVLVRDEGVGMSVFVEADPKNSDNEEKSAEQIDEQITDQPTDQPSDQISEQGDNDQSAEQTQEQDGEK